MSCNHCGEYYHWPEFLDKLQHVRNLLGRPIVINSAHRCPIHNARVGGAPKSEHKKIAADIQLSGHDPITLYRACVEAGFTGFGFYNSFLHVDMGRPRSWPAPSKRNPQWKDVEQ